ncbi:MAG: hypothetical protein JJE07_10880 [Flavobacteriaceae bacterium]|nr:hypothetical protein [Flavobacteriaceae bacterium]
MRLSETGKIAHNFWIEISNHFPFVKLGEFIVMPNHMHGIIIIDKMDDGGNVHVETPKLGVSITFPETTKSGAAAENIQYLGNPKPTISKSGGKNEQWKPGTLGVIINQYKRICTINARKIHSEFGWQTRFYDIIIRDDRAFQTISNYIINNPAKWQGRPNWAYLPQYYSFFIGIAKNGIFAFLNNFNETLSRKIF